MDIIISICDHLEHIIGWGFRIRVSASFHSYVHSHVATGLYTEEVAEQQGFAFPALCLHRKPVQKKAKTIKHYGAWLHSHYLNQLQ